MEYAVMIKAEVEYKVSMNTTHLMEVKQTGIHHAEDAFEALRLGREALEERVSNGRHEPGILIQEFSVEEAH